MILSQQEQDNNYCFMIQQVDNKAQMSLFNAHYKVLAPFEVNFIVVYAFPKGTIYQDVFIYIMFCISMSR